MAKGLDMPSDRCIKLGLFRPSRVAYYEILAYLTNLRFDLGLATLFIYLEIQSKNPLGCYHKSLRTHRKLHPLLKVSI